jgi:hypothetical protein
MKRILAAISASTLVFGMFPVAALGSPVSITQSISSASLLAELQVEEEAFSYSYKRSAFSMLDISANVVRARITASTVLAKSGPSIRHWIDADSNRCDTRREVLAAESLRKVSCRTLRGGRWFSAFDNAKTRKASKLDVDHMVPLKEAWESGAHSWDSATRTSFANDLDYEHSLIAVSARSNRSKSDRDPNNWMPPSTSFHCQYVGRWIAVKYRWSLSVDPAEKSFLDSKVSSCGAAADVKAPQKASITAGSTPVQTQPPASTSNAGTDPRFASCAEAKRNGYRGPYVRGVNPEYAWYQDRDRDGVVCE